MEKQFILKENPDKRQLTWGLILGALYFFDVLIYVPYFIMLYLFGNPTNQLDSNVFATIAQLITILICTTIIMIVLKPKFKDIKDGFKNPNIILYIFVCIGASIGMSYVLSILDTIIFERILNLPPTTTNANQSSIELLFAKSPVIAMLLVVVGAPIIEELIFRYFIFGGIARKNVVLAFIMSGLIFGLVHMGITISEFVQSGFSDTASLINDFRQLPDYIGSGVVFCYVYYKTKTILTPILGHAVHNLISGIAILASLSNFTVRTKDIETIDNITYVTIETGTEFEQLNAQIDRVFLHYTFLDENNQECSVNVDYTSQDGFVYKFENLDIKDVNGDYIKYIVNIEYSYFEGTEKISQIDEGVYLYAF